MAGGRPRTTIPNYEELEKLGQDMVQWLKDNPDAVHYTEWYSIERQILTKEWDRMIDTPQFRVYYEQARMILASRHMKGSVKEGIAHRFLRMYLCDDLKKAEDQDKDDDVQRKLKELREEIKTLEQLKKEMSQGDLSQK